MASAFYSADGASSDLMVDEVGVCSSAADEVAESVGSGVGVGGGAGAVGKDGMASGVVYGEVASVCGVGGSVGCDVPSVGSGLRPLTSRELLRCCSMCGSCTAPGYVISYVLEGCTWAGPGCFVLVTLFFLVFVKCLGCTVGAYGA